VARLAVLTRLLAEQALGPAQDICVTAAVASDEASRRRLVAERLGAR